MTDWSFDAWPAIEPNWHPGAARSDPWDTMEHHVDIGCGTVKKGRIGIDRYPAPGVNVVMDIDAGFVAAEAPRPGADAVEVLEDGTRRYHAPRYQRPQYSYEISTANYFDYPVPVDFAAPDGYRRAQGMGQALVIGHGLPFESNSIESIITHHCLEHIGEGFIPLMDDIYRVLKPDGIFRAITPLFPSSAAVGDPDHCRYFTESTWLSFCGHLGDENNPTGSWLDSFSVPYTKARFHMEDLDTSPVTPPEKRWADADAREIRVALRAVK